MTKIVSSLILTAASLLAFGAQAASHVGAAPGASMGASGSAMSASAPAKSASSAKSDKKHMQKKHAARKASDASHGGAK